ncbi:MAG: MFS transporter [Candidatus Micrarchaeia archaeon]|jgi:MFS family permease
MLRRLYTINFFDAFIAGVTAVVVPLLMASRGISVESIGLVFALSPVVKPVVRVFAAASADSFGEKANYALGAAGNFAQAIAYALASTPFGFAVGKTCDAARESLIWSVNRPSVMAIAPHRGHFALAGLLSGRFIYNALGSLSVGMLFAAGGFGLLFSAVAAIAALMLLLSLGVKNTHVHGTRIRLSDLSPFGRGRLFYETSGALFTGGSLYIVVIYMLLPLYFSSLGFSLGEIGALYAAYFLINGSALNVLSHRSVRSSKVAYAGAAIFVVTLLGMGLSGKDAVPVFFLAMAFGDACLGLLWEELNWRAVKDSRKKATDLAVMNLPSYAGIAAASALSGFAVAWAGYFPLLALCAASEVAFAAWCLRLAGLKAREGQAGVQN